MSLDNSSTISAEMLRANPMLAALKLSYDGMPVLFRPVLPGDANILSDYFLSLSDQTKQRYGPHRFDRETAEELVATTDHAQTLRMIATVASGVRERVIAYIILILGIREDDAARYELLNMALNANTDCTLAPSVADEYQGKGLGSMLLKHLMLVARRLGRKRMVLWGGTQATNARAIHYYHKHGFVTVGEFQEPPGHNNYDMIMDL